jgi:hypothetical protein
MAAMDTSERQLRHLEMIQRIVERMSTNSFHLTGWSVVLVSALFALAAANADVRFALLALLPAGAFWVLDGYFLRQERLYIRLYDDVRIKDEGAPTSMSMSTAPFEKEEKDWLGVCFSKTLVVFHGSICGSVLVVLWMIVLSR